jgi:hypothetical protein
MKIIYIEVLFQIHFSIQFPFFQKKLNEKRKREFNFEIKK